MSRAQRSPLSNKAERASLSIVFELLKEGAMRTRITEMLGIKFPVVQGGMGFVAEPQLAAAVSNAGGLGTLTGTSFTPDVLVAKIREVRALTSKPFAVNFTPGCQNLEANLEVCAAERVAAVTFGRGRHTTELVTRILRPRGILSIPNVGSVRQAVRVEEEGADIVIASGSEGGGHVGHIATLPLVSQVTSKVRIPVIAAGGFADGRGLAAALCLGASGIQMGSRFVCTRESPAHINVKKKMVEATEEDTVVTTHITGITVRNLKNGLTEAFAELERKKATPEEFQKLSAGRARLSYIEGNAEMGAIGCGQSVGLIRDIPTCQELIGRMIAEAEKAMEMARGQVVSA